MLNLWYRRRFYRSLSHARQRALSSRMFRRRYLIFECRHRLHFVRRRNRWSCRRRHPRSTHRCAEISATLIIYCHICTRPNTHLIDQSFGTDIAVILRSLETASSIDVCFYCHRRHRSLLVATIAQSTEFWQTRSPVANRNPTIVLG